MHIRPASIDDVEMLFDIRCSVHENHMSREEMAQQGITPEAVRDMICGGNYIVPLGLVGEEAAAFAMAQISQGYLFALFVAPEHEAKGIGGTLLMHVEEELRRHGVREAWLATDANEAVRAVGFYRHYGWRDAGLMDDGQLRMCKQIVAAL